MILTWQVNWQVLQIREKLVVFVKFLSERVYKRDLRVKIEKKAVVKFFVRHAHIFLSLHKLYTQ